MSQISSHPVSPPSTLLLPPPCSSRYLRKGIFLGLSSQIKFGGCSIKSGTFRAIFLKGFIMWKKKFKLKVKYNFFRLQPKHIKVCGYLFETFNKQNPQFDGTNPPDKVFLQNLKVFVCMRGSFGGFESNIEGVPFHVRLLIFHNTRSRNRDSMNNILSLIQIELRFDIGSQLLPWYPKLFGYCHVMHLAILREGKKCIHSPN